MDNFAFRVKPGRGLEGGIGLGGIVAAVYDAVGRVVDAAQELAAGIIGALRVLAVKLGGALGQCLENVVGLGCLR